MFPEKSENPVEPSPDISMLIPVYEKEGLVLKIIFVEPFTWSKLTPEDIKEGLGINVSICLLSSNILVPLCKRFKLI